MELINQNKIANTVPNHKEVYINDMDCAGVPYDLIVHAVNNMEYGCVQRIMFEALFLTGCRPSELDRFKFSHKECFLEGNWLYWRPGKNQKGWRKEFLPNYFLKELAFYRANNRVPEGAFFGIDQETFRAYFNKFIRKNLGQAWNRKKKEKANFGGGYLYQLKGLRKSFATLIFAQLYVQWKDAGVALELTSKRMKHTKNSITINHYIKEFETLNIEKWKDCNPSDILVLANQRRLKEFEPDQVILDQANNQARVQDYI